MFQRFLYLKHEYHNPPVSRYVTTHLYPGMSQPTCIQVCHYSPVSRYVTTHLYPGMSLPTCIQECHYPPASRYVTILTCIQECHYSPVSRYVTTHLNSGMSLPTCIQECHYPPVSRYVTTHLYPGMSLPTCIQVCFLYFQLEWLVGMRWERLRDPGLQLYCLKLSRLTAAVTAVTTVGQLAAAATAGLQLDVL